jgi:NADH-quinone oxidoreductase subunit E
LTELEVRNVISYYSMLTTKPRGKFNVQVCTNISCLVRGGEEILRTARRNWASAIKERPPTDCLRWKKWSALGRAAGLRRRR